ncbi:MAG: Lpg1974 family pore-forming outer membrane protein, partial [Candidatus Acidiferrum sp.]
DMRWRAGLRYANVFFDSRADQPVAQAAVGGGIQNKRVSNSYAGIGPHAGLDLSRPFGSSGFSFVAQSEFALLAGRIRQQFEAVSTATGPDGQPLVGATSIASSQGAPVLGVRAGVSWHPPRFSHTSFYLGYVYEHWWDVGVISNANNLNGTFGDLSDQGIVVRASFDF